MPEPPATVPAGFWYPMRPCVPRRLPATPDDYLMQTKYDGWNVVIASGCIWTRRGKEITDWCTDWGFDLSPSVPVNGELLADEAGAPAARADIQGIRSGRCRPRLRAFDVMVEGPTLEERLQRLTALAAGRMQVAATVDPMHLGGTWTHVNQLLAETQADGHEGLILKRRGSLYQPSREVSVLTEDWLKLKVPVAASA